MTDRFTVQDKQYMELNPVSERQRREVTGFASGRIESEMKQSFMEVEMVMKKKWMVLMTLTMSLTAASAAWPGVFDNYVDYQNPDGTYSYYFDQGVLVTLDENWYQNTIVKTSDRGATFYQKASYDAYEKEGMEGGRLFTIGASVNSSFSELPSFEYIGFDEDSCMNYYAELPTDYQAYMGDASIQAEYDALWSQVKDVIAGIRIGSEIHAGNETVDVGGIMRQMNEITMSAHSGYDSLWESRTDTYDILSQEYSDAILGYDRLYDSETGEVYRAELGFWDDYDLHRGEYNNPNLQKIDDSSRDYYLQTVDYTISR